MSHSSFYQTDYREILQNEITTAQKRNPNMSLRAFAKRAQVSPALLSKVLQKKCHLSRASATRLGASLGWSKKKQEYFNELLTFETTKNEKQRGRAEQQLVQIKKTSRVREIPSQSFKDFGHWYHFAILDLMCLKNYVHDATWISKVLTITHEDAVKSLEILKEMDFYHVLPDGTVRPNTPAISSPDNISSTVLRNNHHVLLQRAARSLNSVSVNERYALSTTIPLSKEAYQVLVNLARRFAEETIVNVQTEEQADSLYCMTLNIFPIKK